MKIDNNDQHFAKIERRELVIHQLLKFSRLLGLISILYFGSVSAMNWNRESIFIQNFVGLLLSGVATSQMHIGVILTKENVIKPEDLSH